MQQTNRLFENEFRVIYYEPESKILFFKMCFGEDTTPMEEVEAVGENFVHYCEAYRPHHILIDASEYFFYTNEKGFVENYVVNIAPVIKRSGVKKVAVMMPQSLISLAFIDNISQSIQKRNPKNYTETKYFDSMEHALRWLQK